jgi:two-component sensor histidine kinase
MIGSKKKCICIGGLVTTCFLLLCSLACFAQVSVSSLKKQLRKTRADNNRVNLLIQISGYYGSVEHMPNAADSALTYGLAAEKLSTKIGYTQGLINSYMALVKGYWLKNDTAAYVYYSNAGIALSNKDTSNKPPAGDYAQLKDDYNVSDGGGNIHMRLGYSEQPLTLSRQAGATERAAVTLKALGSSSGLRGKDADGLAELRKAVSAYWSLSNRNARDVWDLMAVVYNNMGSYQNALKYALQAVYAGEEQRDTSIAMCPIYTHAGFSYNSLGQFSQAITYYKKALAVAQKSADFNSMSLISCNIADTYNHLNKPQLSLFYLKRSLEKYPPANINYKSHLIAWLVNNYVGLKQYDTAQYYCNELLRLSKKAGNYYTQDKSTVHQAILGFYLATNQLKQARAELEIYKGTGQSYSDRTLQLSALLFEVKLDSAQGNYPAAVHALTKYTLLRDSVYNETKSKQISAMEIGFQVDKKDQEIKAKNDHIKLLTKDTQLQKANLQQAKTTEKLIIAATVLLAMLLGLSCAGYRSKKRANRQLKAQRVEIEQKNNSLTTLLHEKDNLLLEKEWLMKEIHHRVKNNLQIVISLLNTQSSYLQNDIAYNAIRESQHRMQSISLIHQKLYQSDNLALVDVHAYITDLVNYLQDSFDTGTRIEFETDIASAELDVTRAVPLGLILNEAITNAIKYAFPDNRKGKITISLKVSYQNCFALKIHDNGVGFPATVDITKSKSLGMSLMRGLSKQLGGSLKVAGGQGITIEVDFINDTLLKAV